MNSRATTGIAEWVRLSREEREWTQLELAARLGVQPGDVSRWERGLGDMHLGRFRQLCVLFNCSADVALRLAASPSRKRRRRRPAAAAEAAA